MGYVDHLTRRRQLIDSTIDVIASYGLDGVTTRRIAEAAGAPLASIHYTFGSKEALLAAALERLVQDLGDELRESVAGAPSLREALETVMARVAELLDEPRYALLMAGLPGADSERILAAWNHYQGIGTDLVEQVVSTSGERLSLSVEQIGRLLIAAINGVLERHAIDADAQAAAADLGAFARAIAVLATGA